MKKTVTRMADGRELIYYDESDDARHDAVDRRDLPPPPPASRLRYDPLMDEWIAIAAHRQTRTFLPPTDECPLCPSTADRLTEIPSNYDVAVFENRFPSFSDHDPDLDDPVLPSINRQNRIVKVGDAVAERGKAIFEDSDIVARHGQTAARSTDGERAFIGRRQKGARLLVTAIAIHSSSADRSEDARREVAAGDRAGGGRRDKRRLFSS